MLHRMSWCASATTLLGRLALGCLILLWVSDAQSGSDRLLATGGVTQLEGSAGGGLTPWALIAGIGTDRQLGASANCTYIRPRHFELTSCGVALGIDDRLELSYARQAFDLDDVAPGHSIEQNIFGAKVRLMGDAVFDQDRWWPQVAVGLQFKQNEDFHFIPQLIGARQGHGTDVYLTATKMYLAGPASRMWLVSATLRASRANQFGILGFGGDRADRYRALVEGSAGVFVTDRIVAGAEYRQKPNNLRAFREQSAHDVFLAWFASKHIAFTAAYVSLGTIATHSDETAWYLALQGSY